MKVIRAHYAGACYGVQRALNLALKQAKQPTKTFTLGPLIHNPQVVSQLAEQGVSQIDSVEDITRADAVVIRSHGVTPQVMRAVSQKSATVVDATCPHVSRAQRAAAQLAEQFGCVIVVGEKGHPEVEGLVACAREKCSRVYALTSIEELPDNLPDHLGIVVQTTQQKATLDAIVAHLQKRNITVEVKNTICDATSQRQDTAAELAQHVDGMVIIGGRNSSNTTRLADICRQYCKHVFHIEHVSELYTCTFDDIQVMGVSAGASTPEDQIEAVISYLEQLS